MPGGFSWGWEWRASKRGEAYAGSSRRHVDSVEDWDRIKPAAPAWTYLVTRPVRAVAILVKKKKKS